MPGMGHLLGGQLLMDGVRLQLCGCCGPSPGCIPPTQPICTCSTGGGCGTSACQRVVGTAGFLRELRGALRQIGQRGETAGELGGLGAEVLGGVGGPIEQVGETEFTEVPDGARAESDGDKSDGPLGDEPARVRAQAGEVRGGGAQAGAVGRDREEGRAVVGKQIRAGAGQQKRERDRAVALP